uniref:Secreted protein n=1 Tax=Rhipicephalus zambeziensis TaxID=60191 RepID=A0A224YI90_9ACAR
MCFDSLYFFLVSLHSHLVVHMSHCSAPCTAPGIDRTLQKCCSLCCFVHGCEPLEPLAIYSFAVKVEPCSVRANNAAASRPHQNITPYFSPAHATSGFTAQPLNIMADLCATLLPEGGIYSDSTPNRYPLWRFPGRLAWPRIVFCEGNDVYQV